MLYFDRDTRTNDLRCCLSIISFLKQNLSVHRHEKILAFVNRAVLQ